jgi:integrase/recombinase XerD
MGRRLNLWIGVTPSTRSMRRSFRSSPGPVSMSIKAMMETCKQGKLSDARDKACLLVLLDTGMRLTEFLSLNIADVDPITGMILIRSGKGRKPRNVYLGDKSRLMLRRYVRNRKDYNPALWVARSGETNRDWLHDAKATYCSGCTSSVPHDSGICC